MPENISIVMTGMCEGCTMPDLKLERVTSTYYGNYPTSIEEITEWRIHCIHENACKKWSKEGLG